ncbi:PAP2 superfamily-domain-containing protein [Pseudomassariella vexata]|uniref:PAP2 superfamily-domain-containing protein n=1 Tax=Pseudomassariella vexata TaxID=1141098 RepID=A0A1Y2DSS2_9PEZI|nr:PAP2 superfamily-domain-containing protein [Pseudomassariella vexata]ORY62300.1 PAP2 superfamily-domain-containing protein [Pseudomassariella vexata]
MPDLDFPLPARQKPKPKMPFVLIASYITDWLCIAAAGAIGTILGNVTPNKRPFLLEDPNISFPFTEHETVDTMTLLLCVAALPIVVILFVTLVFVPGPTVPAGTPKALIWKRKLWELHIGWLGLAFSLCSAWFITSGMKNLFGKPRPDMLSRCKPDIDNMRDYIVGGFSFASDGRLVSAAICQSTDKSILDDGFRSYPSGHSSSAAAGLIYLSFFLASKFAVVIPFMAPGSYTTDSSAMSSFPSRMPNAGNRKVYEPVHSVSSQAVDDISAPDDPAVSKQIAEHSTAVFAVRKQAAAPPLYLLLLTALPFFGSIFIASSRWFDFRHHGFDILFGFMIGLICAWFAFRYYHLPISQGAGWAWAPRSSDKAFWAGVGSYSYATDKKHWIRRSAEEGAQAGQAPAVAHLATVRDIPTNAADTFPQ